MKLIFISLFFSVGQEAADEERMEKTLHKNIEIENIEKVGEKKRGWLQRQMKSI